MAGLAHRGAWAAALVSACASSPPQKLRAPAVRVTAPLEATKAVVPPSLESMALVHLMRGLYFMQSGEAAAAIPHLRLALIYDRDSAFIHDRLADAWWQINEPGRAREALDQGLEANPRDPWLNASAGTLALESGLLHRAVAHLERALGEPSLLSRAGPAHVAALFMLERGDEAVEAANRLRGHLATPGQLVALAEVLEEHGALDAAYSVYADAQQMRPPFLAAAEGRARTAELLGRYADALLAVTDVLAHHRESLHLWVRAVHLARMAADPAALAYQRAARRLVGKRPEGLFELARAYQAEGEGDLAEETLSACLTYDPSHLEARVVLARLWAMRGQTQRCVARLRGPPLTSSAMRVLAECTWHEGNREEALSLWVQVLQREPEHLLEVVAVLGTTRREALARRFLNRLLLGLDVGSERARAALDLAYDHPESARDRLEPLMVEAGDDEELTQLWALANLRANHADHAVQALEPRAMETDDAAWLSLMGASLLGTGTRLAEAGVLLYRAHRLDPQNATVLDNLAQYLHVRGALEMAARTLRRAATLRPRDVAIWLHLGDVLTAMGDVDAAVAAYQRGSSTGPTVPLQKQLDDRLGRSAGR